MRVSLCRVCVSLSIHEMTHWSPLPSRVGCSIPNLATLWAPDRECHTQWYNGEKERAMPCPIFGVKRQGQSLCPFCLMRPLLLPECGPRSSMECNRPMRLLVLPIHTGGGWREQGILPSLFSFSFFLPSPFDITLNKNAILHWGDSRHCDTVNTTIHHAPAYTV